jgi:hypothetical protein
MCVGVVALHGLAQTFPKEANAWSAGKREQTCQCVVLPETGNSYKRQFNLRVRYVIRNTLRSSRSISLVSFSDPMKVVSACSVLLLLGFETRKK